MEGWKVFKSVKFRKDSGKGLVLGSARFQVRVNLIFPVVLLATYFTGNLVEYLISFFSILLHELGHVAAAILARRRVHSINIMPIGLCAAIEEGGCSRWNRILIYSSGPAVNILLLTIGMLLNTYYLLKSDDMRFFILVNTYLAFFNMMPVVPLDGGKILREVLAARKGLRLAGNYIRKSTLVLSFIIIVFGAVQLTGGLQNFSLLFIGIYVFSTLKSEEMEASLMNVKEIVYRRSRLLKKGVYQARDLVVVKSVRIGEIMKNMDFDRFHIIHVLDDNLRVIKVLTEQEVIDGMLRHNTDMTFEEFIAAERQENIQTTG